MSVSQEDLWTDLKTETRKSLLAKYGSVMAALAHGLRGAIIAQPGKVLYVADFASIEARVLLWCAGDEAGLDLFRNHQDIYCDMASAIYHRPITKDDKTERGIGKIACLGADTLVLTSAGWLPIIQVQNHHLVWDGQQWTSHGGVVYNGIRETICHNQLTSTPDHLFLADLQNHWARADEVAHLDSVQRQVLATGWASLPLQPSSWGRGEVSNVSMFGAPVEPLRIQSENRIFDVDAVPAVLNALRQKLQSLVKKSTGITRIFSQTWYRGLDFLIESARSLLAARTRQTKTITTTEGEVSGSTVRGSRDTNQDGGAERLRGDGGSSRIYSRFLAGTTRLWNWTGRKTTRATNPETCSLFPALSIRETADRSENFNSASRSWKPVYDIINAGPLHRYMVLTNQGPVLAHNCLGLGYQMGPSKFCDTCEKGGSPILEDTYCEECGNGAGQHRKENHPFQFHEGENEDTMTAVKVVAAYRAKYWRVKQMWEDQEASAIAAVESRSPVQCGKVRWVYTAPFLYCELPSGRRLAYNEPRVKLTMMPWGKQKAVLSYMGVNPVTRQWTRQSVYGGLLTENIVQAIARDLMADGMLRAEATGRYAIVLSVHDELIAEANDDTGSVKEFEALMSETPDWAFGCPVEAEGWSGKRYRK